MEWWLAGLIGLICGVLVAVVARRAGTVRREALQVKAAEVHPQVAALLAVLRSGALIVGGHDEVLHSSARARGWGLSRGDRVGFPEVLEMVRCARRTGETQGQELEIKRGISGASLHLVVRVAPLEGSTMVVLAEDRTPLLRADATRRDFVTNVSHELKTPIGAISLLAEAITQANDDPEAVIHFGERIGTEATRLSQLVTQIINLSRLQADDPMLDADPVEPADLTQIAVSRTEELARDREVTVVRAGESDWVVLGDADQLADAVTNLVSNAVVYSEAGSRVAVSHRLVTDADGNFVEISVADNGIGIRPEDQQRIFERFYRVDYGRSRASGGTGLGLSIVKHIAAVHGGTVTVWSQLGQGSTFTIRLPATPAPAELADLDEALDESPSATPQQSSPQQSSPQQSSQGTSERSPT